MKESKTHYAIYAFPWLALCGAKGKLTYTHSRTYEMRNKKTMVITPEPGRLVSCKRCVRSYKANFERTL